LSESMWGTFLRILSRECLYSARTGSSTREGLLARSFPISISTKARVWPIFMTEVREASLSCLAVSSRALAE
jgi:hypothetical protein